MGVLGVANLVRRGDQHAELLLYFTNDIPVHMLADLTALTEALFTDQSRSTIPVRHLYTEPTLVDEFPTLRHAHPLPLGID